MKSKIIKNASIQMLQEKSLSFYLLIVLLFIANISIAQIKPPIPYGAVPNKNQLIWAKETDLYSMLNFSTITYFNREWGYGNEAAEKFNPTQFNAKQIVLTAKAAGIKGIIIDAKHHGGFCLWPSKFNDNYSVKNCPWKNGKGDIVRELADACRAEGLKVGIYLSPWDRNHKDYGTPAYLEYYENQLTEVLTQYGPLFEIWLDGANGGSGYYGGAKETRTVDQKNYYPIKKWFELIRKYQPNTIIFSDMGPDARWNGNEHGVSGEKTNGTCWASLHQRQWADGSNMKQLNSGDREGEFYNPAEADFPLLDKAWFWNPHTCTRTSAELVNLYFTSIGRNSTMDIGIAPDTLGLMSNKDVASLKGFGERIRAIFSTNLARSAKVSASNVRGGSSKYSAKNVLNGWEKGKYWATDDAVLTPELVLDFSKPTEFSVISLRENIALGERIDDWALDSWQNNEWKEFAKGTCIGMRRLWRGEPITSRKIRLRITKAAACPALAELAVYLEPKQIREECRVK
jgi:alpha-L-fucosidase